MAVQNSNVIMKQQKSTAHTTKKLQAPKSIKELEKTY